MRLPKCLRRKKRPPLRKHLYIGLTDHEVVYVISADPRTEVFINEVRVWPYTETYEERVLGSGKK